MTARRRTVVLVGLGVVAVVGAVTAVWFQPQKLWIDEKVAESAPTTAAVTREPGGAAPDRPTDLATGDFVSLDHGTSGRVRVLGGEGRASVVRLESLDTSNGPDLFVYLSTNRVDGPEGGFDDDYVNLGRLKGNKGDQNYDVPPDVVLAKYASVVIWCDRFNSAFGAAALVRS
jgi:hypothetical protein